MNRLEEAGVVGQHTPCSCHRRRLPGGPVHLAVPGWLGARPAGRTPLDPHHPRGRGNNVRTMELFRVAGVQRRIEEAASVLAENHGIMQTPTLVGDAGEWLFKEIDRVAGSPASAPARGACAARTTWSRCC